MYGSLPINTSLHLHNSSPKQVTSNTSFLLSFYDKGNGYPLPPSKTTLSLNSTTSNKPPRLPHKLLNHCHRSPPTCRRQAPVVATAVSCCCYTLLLQLLQLLLAATTSCYCDCCHKLLHTVAAAAASGCCCHKLPLPLLQLLVVAFAVAGEGGAREGAGAIWVGGRGKMMQLEWNWVRLVKGLGGELEEGGGWEEVGSSLGLWGERTEFHIGYGFRGSSGSLSWSRFSST